MQFLVTAFDGTDAEAPSRRRAAVDAHRVYGQHMMKAGHVLFSSILLDDNGEETIGSFRVMQFETRAELDDWLEQEPYVKQDVWKDIDIRRCRIGPAFEWMTLEPGEIHLDTSPAADPE